ncbi:MAG: hypothetical protein NC213_06585 [Acetobacter sp.]|nr:hypothetical protein [Bacteroides sp.]MCM1341392.1 hypothetical protein [Acetobacter sp.]MCM1433486.1 hypothetical protein [Clostridiales bacterium]
MSKLKRIINNCILNVKKSNVNSIPSIFATYYYGNFKVNTGSLVIVYIFETDSNLKMAHNNGLTKKIEKETKENLINNGYPIDAFTQERSNLSEQTFLDRLNNPKVSILFISNQRVQEEANGILFEYLK